MRRDVFQAIADPTRRAIISYISTKPMTPNAIAGHFHSSRQAISKHIKILSECALVKQQQQGREIYYYVDLKKLKEADKWFTQFRTKWEIKYNQLDNILKQLKNKKS